MGLVGKNAILLVDYTDTLRRRGLTRTEALVEAGPTRLRPIVMTTMSVVVALAPLAFGIEEGSELLKSAAVVLIGGLLTSTLLTLVFIPAMYTIFDDLEASAKRLVGRVSPPRRFESRELSMLMVDAQVHIWAAARASGRGNRASGELGGQRSRAANRHRRARAPRAVSQRSRQRVATPCRPIVEFATCLHDVRQPAWRCSHLAGRPAYAIAMANRTRTAG